MGIILSPIAQFLYMLVGIINTPLKLYRMRKTHGFFKAYSEEQFNAAKETDIFGNERYYDTWNLLFIKKDGYKFGEKGETISSALGKNQLQRTLTWFGWVIVAVLWVLDFRWIKNFKWYRENGGHCIISINK